MSAQDYDIEYSHKHGTVYFSIRDEISVSDSPYYQIEVMETEPTDELLTEIYPIGRVVRLKQSVLEDSSSDFVLCN